MVTFAEDECRHVIDAYEAGNLDGAESWYCKRCDTEWRPHQVGPLTHWAPYEYISVIRR